MSGAGNNAFFAGAWRNHQMPQSVFNGPSGALPPADTSGYSNGLNAQADARINYNSTLLGDLVPYAYGKPGRLSSQTAFLAIPHMLQKVVPVLSLPTARWPCNETTKLYHSVDDGDIAFTINIDRESGKHAEGIQLLDKVGAMRAIDPFCNLATVNYLLAGIQLYSDIRDPNCSAWRQFIRDIGLYSDKVHEARISSSWQVLKIVRDVFVPFGVPRGSDKQGGQSQGTNSPDVFPVDHVTSMLLDGKCQNIVNVWRANEVSAGDDMILVMRKIVPTDYVLSRQTNSYNRQRFGGWPTMVDGQDLEERRIAGVWQLVPQVYNMADEPEHFSEYDYRENGYWHICRALQQSGANPQHKFDNYNDATQYQKTGELLEVSFQPLFIEGMTSGSSKHVIQKKDSYPIEKEMLGISSIFNGARSGLQPLPGGGYRAPNRGLGGAGPDPAAWLTYLKAQFPKAHARKNNVLQERVVRRRLDVGGFGEQAGAILEVAGDEGAMADMMTEDAGHGQSVGDQSVGDQSVGGAAIATSRDEVGGEGVGAAVSSSSSKPKPAAAAKGGNGKKAAAVMMGLSGSYIGGNGAAGGDAATAAAASGKKGSVRASLLTMEPPPPPE